MSLQITRRHRCKISLCLLVPLISCAQPAGQTPTNPLAAEAPATEEAAAKPAQPLPVASIDATWSFEVSETGCRAVASTGTTLLQVTSRPGEDLQVDLQLGKNSPVSIRTRGTASVVSFSNNSEKWQWRARAAASRTLRATLPPTELSLAQILTMLQGGTVSLTAGGSGHQMLRLLPAGDAAIKWFSCIRRMTAAKPGEDS